MEYIRPELEIIEFDETDMLESSGEPVLNVVRVEMFGDRTEE